MREHQAVNVENLKSVKTRRIIENEDDTEPQRKRRKKNKDDSVSKDVSSTEEQEKTENENVDEKVPQRNEEETKKEEPEEGTSFVSFGCIVLNFKLHSRRKFGFFWKYPEKFINRN